MRELGTTLLNAFQQGDAEYLASMRAEHERQPFDLTLAVRQDQWREADWQVQALAKTKESAQANLRYFSNLARRPAGGAGFQLRAWPHHPPLPARRGVG